MRQLTTVDAMAQAAAAAADAVAQAAVANPAPAVVRERNLLLHPLTTTL